MVCFAKSSALFNTVALLASFYFALCKDRSRCLLLLALSVILSIYSITLFIPLLLLLIERSPMKKRATIVSLGNFISYLILWSGLSWWLSGLPFPSVGTDSLESFKNFVLCATPVGCNAFVHDLRPNLGLAWYLFVEMFDHFRSYFLTVFQVHLFVYVLPASLKFFSDPVLLTAILVAVQSIFRPYPTLADSVVLLMFFSFIGSSLLQRSIILPVYPFCMLAFSLLCLINWHNWIQQGSGNANFFYASVLFYTISHVFLVLDLVYQWLVRDIERRNPGVDLEGIYQR